MNNVVLYKYLVVYEHESVYLWNGKFIKRQLLSSPLT